MSPEPLPGEPSFTLLARDPLAGFLVSIWSSLRQADGEAARIKFGRMIEQWLPHYWREPDVDGAHEALDIGMAMFRWREANDGRWREPQPQPVWSADAQRVGDRVRVSLRVSHDPGPVRGFSTVREIDLDEMHALELLGTLTVALADVRSTSGADAAGARS